MEKVRFGRINDTRIPKNTLVTMRVEDCIFFGISRCRIRGKNPDKFNKKVGVERARLRANIALKNPPCDWIVDESFYLHDSGLFGQVNVSNVGKLLSYFHSID